MLKPSDNGPRCARLFEFCEPKTEVEIVGPINQSRAKNFQKKIKKIPGRIRGPNSVAATPVADDEVAGDPMTSMTSFRQSLCISYKASSFLL